VHGVAKARHVLDAQDLGHELAPFQFLSDQDADVVRHLG
jgi:hypothetical protein